MADARTTPPLLTVITVTYNAEEYLEGTLQSVHSQTCDDIEHLIIDGGSTDGTLDLVKKYEAGIDRWISEPDEGIFDAMNKGIQMARGRWVNFMNAGDSFCGPEVVSQIALEKRAGRALVYGDTIEYGKVTRAFPVEYLRRGIIMAVHQSMFFNKEILGDILYHDGDYEYNADYECVIRIYRENPEYLEYVPIPVADYLGGGHSAQLSWRKRRDKYAILYRMYGISGLLRGFAHRLFAGRGHIPGPSPEN